MSFLHLIFSKLCKFSRCRIDLCYGELLFFTLSLFSDARPSHGRGSGLTWGLLGPYPLKISYAQLVPTIEAKKKMQVAKERALSKVGRTAVNPRPSGYGASAH
jgi:hypothetical protein